MTNITGVHKKKSFSVQDYLAEMRAYEKQADSHNGNNSPFINISIKNHIGHLELNRPKALNALNPYMMHTLWDQLNKWKDDPNVHAIILTSNSDRAFCAGGDLRALYEAWTQNRHALLEFLFRKEYQLDLLIKSYPKPYISFIDGIVMGGGMGISQNGQYRLMGDNTISAMPETKIGFFPDAGATSFLQSCPGHIGLYLGMTGNTCDIADSLYIGFASHYMNRSTQEKTLQEIFKIDSKDANNRSLKIKKIIEAHTQDKSPLVSDSFLKKNKENIDRFFSADTFKVLITDLENAARNDNDKAHQFAKETFETLKKRSPLSLLVTFHQMQKSKNLKNFKDIMELEFSLSQAFLKTPDFREGIRSVIIDKDNTPRWRYNNIKDVFDLDIEAFFKPLSPSLYTTT